MKSGINISVIIATRNRAEGLRATIESLGHHSFEHVKYEIIIVANGCSDNTSTIIADLTSKWPIIPLNLDRAGKSAALNKGMELARGELLAFTDDDVVLSEKWLTELSRACHSHESAAGFCGPIIPIYPEIAPLWIRRHPFKVPGFAEFMPPFTAPQPCPRLPFGPNFAIRAQASRGLLFRTDLGASDTNGPISCEDTDFASRFREKAGPIWFIPSAAVGHRVRTEQLTITWLVERAFILGRSLIAQQVPTGPCHAPVWQIGWHPAIWSSFDRSLVINFLLGQLYQCRLRGAEGDRITLHIHKLLPEILPQGMKTLLSASSQDFLISNKCSELQFLLDEKPMIPEHRISAKLSV